MKRSCLVFVLLALWLLALSGCAAPDEGKAAPDDGPAQSSALPEVSPEESETPEPAPVEEPSPAVEPYLFGQPVEESEAVEESWFEDAVFLGDSRTEGLQLFSGLRTGDFIWYKGMSVFKVDDPRYRYIEVDGEAMTMMEALALKQYAKVYIMIGINELGYPAESYEDALRTMVDRVREIQPDAVIYLQTLPPVNETVAKEKGLGSYIKNSRVNAFNEAIYRVAWEKQTALLDVAEVYRTENGDLAADMATDGVHFYRQGYAQWYEYLRTHTLDAERYAAGEPLAEAIVPVVPVPSEPMETPSPSPEPSPTPLPSPSPDPAPEPSQSPTPTQTPEPVPSPDPEPVTPPDPGPDPVPEETPEPEPAPDASETPAPETPEPDGSDTPEETPAPEPSAPEEPSDESTGSPVGP